MMLSTVESRFVRLLRETVIWTAGLALIVAGLALLYAAYAWLAPEPKANLAQQVARIRQAVDPAALLKEIFPSDSEIYKAAALPDQVTYESRPASDNAIFEQFNSFLQTALDASFESEKQFSDWLYGNNRIQFSLPQAINDKQARNEDNIDVLWRALLLDYAKRLTARADVLGTARKQRLYPTPFNRLTAPTGQARAPYFLVWFFERLQAEFRRAEGELNAAAGRRYALRLSIPFALGVALSAFSYFIFIMFLFLFVSLEASVRDIATTMKSKSSAAPPSAASS